MRALAVAIGIALLACAGCDNHRAHDDASASDDASSALDSGSRSDASVGSDSGAGSDGGSIRDASVDASSRSDAGASADSGAAADTNAPHDAGIDAWSGNDAGHDGGHDAAVSSGGCVSGAAGTIAVRFQWRGSGPGSTAYVSYELNQLPDTSRWRVSAASMSIGYTPIYDDTFLGEGGLDLEGTAFIDVELSTAGASISSATIAIYGRSFDTTTSGSFSWQTFSGVGAAPTDLVSNVAPYEWYLADATSELPAGDGNTLLRIYPGPSSNALIVDRVEICFAP